MDKDIRLDKWLWAARFFKTRQLAKDAIEGGKIHYQGQRTKVSKRVNIGDMISIQQGYYKKTVEVLDLSDKRGSASIAQALYQETDESIVMRETLALQHKLAASTAPQHRPNKKDRRSIIQFIGQDNYDL